MKKLLLLTAIAVFCSFQSDSQITYTKVVVEQVVTPDQETAITEHFRHVEGVQTCRMDRINHVFLAIYDSSQIQDASFTNWFVNNGYSILCYYTDDYKTGEMVSISITNCK
jgi:hypothetical protein